jgi:hypothetical protein
MPAFGLWRIQDRGTPLAINGPARSTFLAVPVDGRGRSSISLITATPLKAIRLCGDFLPNTSDREALRAGERGLRLPADSRQERGAAFT